MTAIAVDTRPNIEAILNLPGLVTPEQAAQPRLRRPPRFAAHCG
jgi:hypothetical protein